MLLVAISLVVAWPASAAAPSVKLRPIVEGFERPLLVASHSVRGRRVFVGEQRGVIHRVVSGEQGWRRSGVFLDISDRVASPPDGEGGENGLLGLAFHPRYRDNGLLFVSYTESDGADAYRVVVSRFRRLGSGRGDPDSERVLLRVGTSTTKHFSGHLEFGPDGRLYVGLGDHADPGAGQNRGNLPGSILRIKPGDPDGSGPRTYGIPTGNPNVGRPGKRNEIWSHGLRNPWQFRFDRKTGALWIGDVGADTREEVDRSVSTKAARAGKGVNFGWSHCEGTRKTGSATKCERHRLPVHDYGHADGWCSVTGGAVHRGPGARNWRGLYVAGDFCGGLFVLNGSGKRRYSGHSGRLITSFGEDAEGRIFATTLDGTLHKVVMKGKRP